MRVCVDTNVMLHAFARTSPLAPLFRAIGAGKLELALSTSILLEYEEISLRQGGPAFATKVLSFINLVAQIRGTIVFVEPSFQFRVITNDPDDNKFTDCAITADADFVITDDADFQPMATAGYKPRPIKPAEFVARFLGEF